ncbi:MAG: hypothetical protein AB3N12_01580 [Ruegeria sp.]
MPQSVDQSVPPGQPGPITDIQLEQAIVSAEALRAEDWETMDPQHFRTHLLLVSVCAAPLMRECLEHRQRLKHINQVSDQTNVIHLPQ